MGKVFYDMGFLAKADVVECSATELIGSYVGHTGPKVQKVLENALGRVLFIDEAYRLAGEGFAKEAMDEIVDCLTKPKYAQKLIVILAGYDDDINRLMAQNPGLTSRFPEAIIFHGLEPAECLDLLIQLLRGRQIDMRKKNKDLDLLTLEVPAPGFKREILDLISTLSRTANWANARDVQTIAKSIFGRLLRAGAMKETTAVITEDDVRIVLSSMISERSQRQDAAKIGLSSLHSDMMAQIQNIQAPRTPQTAATTTSAMNTSQAETPQQLAKDGAPATPANEIQRDSGVSDAVWEQLQRDKEAAEKMEEQYQKLVKASTGAADNIKILRQKEQTSEQAFQQAIKHSKDQFVSQKAKQLREEARLLHETERRAQEELLAELESQRKSVEETRKKRGESPAEIKDFRNLSCRLQMD